MKVADLALAKISTTLEYVINDQHTFTCEVKARPVPVNIKVTVQQGGATILTSSQVFPENKHFRIDSKSLEHSVSDVIQLTNYGR